MNNKQYSEADVVNYMNEAVSSYKKGFIHGRVDKTLEVCGVLCTWYVFAKILKMLSKNDKQLRKEKDQ